MKNPKTYLLFVTLLAGLLILQSGCTATPTAPAATATSEIPANLPKITDVQIDQTEVPRYASIELTLQVEAEYVNPYDAREVTLQGIFQAPEGRGEISVPGFWDGEQAWRVRFTPSQEGTWQYQLIITDENGSSAPAEGSFNVIASDLHGWLQVGNWANPAFSSQYLVHHDGTPFYGVGHCDALNILIDGFDAETGVNLFDNMKAGGENYVVWWPLYSNPIINKSYDDYTVSNLSLIDLVVKDAQAKGIFLIFTIWDHPELRDQTHPWGDGRWGGYNGFHNLTSLEEFFTSEESWAWQENLYRYIIARWGYSPAIGMWQTVSEINGTNAYDQTDPWHAKVNAYFVANDPYRHPTTASQSGDVDWPEGHRVMDVPQVHVYSMDNDPQKDVVKAAETIAYWTELMWQTGKPNWIGEFGVKANTYYPELFHNSIWAALGSGAALTPAEWNSGGSWMQMTPAMYADQSRLAQFVAEIPLAWLNPQPLQISSTDPGVRSWGMAGLDGGLIWVQDFSLQGQSIEEVRANQTIRSGAQLEIQGLAEGSYNLTPYDTWQGIFLPSFEVICTAGQACQIPVPDFTADLAFKFERK